MILINYFIDQVTSLVKLSIPFTSRLKYKKYRMLITFVKKHDCCLAYKSIQFMHNNDQNMINLVFLIHL